MLSGKSHQSRRKINVLSCLALVVAITILCVSVINWRFVSSIMASYSMERENEKEADVFSSHSSKVLVPPKEEPEAHSPDSLEINNTPPKSEVLSNPSLRTILPVAQEEVKETLVDLREQGGPKELIIKDIVEKEEEVPKVQQNPSNPGKFSCSGTPLEYLISESSVVHLSDFDCSESNEGWKSHIPPASTNSTRSVEQWENRMNLLDQFSNSQDHMQLDENTKYIVFWPIFAGIGNNLAVFAEVLLIALRSNRKFLGTFVTLTVISSVRVGYSASLFLPSLPV